MTEVFGNQDVATTDHEYNVLAFVFWSLMANVQTATLVQVVSCTNSGADSPVGTVTVQPLVNDMTGSRTPIPQGQVNKCVYARLAAGTNAIIMDPQPGDIGLMTFCSRDTSGVRANAGQANPGSFRMFDWADGVYWGAIPLNVTPTQYIQFLANAIKIITAGTVTITGTSAIAINGPTTITGVTDVVGNTNINGATIAAGSGAAVFPSTVAALSVAATADVTSDSGVNSLNAIAISIGSINVSISTLNSSVSALNTAVTAIENAKVALQTASSAFPNGYVLAAGSNITLTPSGSTLTIAASGGGSGTVTSVALTMPSGFSVGGSPITTNGTLAVTTTLNGLLKGTGTGFTAATSADVLSALGASGVTAGSYTNANITVNAEGIVTAASNGTGGGSAPNALAPSTVNGNLVVWFESDLNTQPSGTSIGYLLPRDPYRMPFRADAPNVGATIDSSTLNGLPVLNFPGNSASIYNIAIGQANLGSCTIFGVINVATSPSEFITGVQNSLDLQLDTSNHITLAKTFTAVIGSSTTAWTANTWFQFNATYNSGTGAFAFRINRTAAGSGTNAQTISVLNDMIGANHQGVNNGSGQGYFNGKIAAAIVYNTVLSGADIATIENYLHTKWGV